jgi:hypothetical protein
LYRAGLKSAADLMKTSLESAERLQKHPLVAIRTAIVAGAQIERAMSLWSDWLSAASESQRKAMQRVQESARTWLAQAAKAGEPRG